MINGSRKQEVSNIQSGMILFTAYDALFFFALFFCRSKYSLIRIDKKSAKFKKKNEPFFVVVVFFLLS